VTTPVENYYSRTETNQRSNNEDSLDRSELSVSDAPPITLLLLADGMGGYAHGEDVSSAALEQFKLTLREKLQPLGASSPLSIDRLKQALLESLQQANDRIRQLVATNNWHKAGSTLVAAAIWQNRLVVTNLGDSPLFHYTAATGKLVKVTLDHSVVGILAQAGIITEEMARHHERRGQLEYYLGGDRSPNPPPVYERELQPGDLVMLCSDGINGLLSTEQIRQILARTDTSLEQNADALILAARAAGETDNQTLMLWCHPTRLEIDPVGLGSERDGESGGGADRISMPQHSEISQQLAHKQPERAQDLQTIDADSPRGREIDRLVANSTSEPPSQVRKQRSISARNLVWALCGSVIAVAAVTIARWDTTGEIIKSLPGYVDGLLNGTPKKVVPKQLPPDREPIDIIQSVVNSTN
jgi:PPM family protein phosphatase